MIHTQCAKRPCCVTVMRILSANDIDVTVVSRPLMLDETDFERAGNGACVTVYSSVFVAIMERVQYTIEVVDLFYVTRQSDQTHQSNALVVQPLVETKARSGVMRRAFTARH